MFIACRVDSRQVVCVHPNRPFSIDYTNCITKYTNHLHAGENIGNDVCSLCCRKSINNIDGETLLFLKELRIEAPEFYYRFVSDRLGVTELRGLRDLNKALTKLGS